MLQRTTKFLKMAVGCAVASFLAFLLIPICSSMEGTFGKIFSIFVALVFWMGLILEQIFFWNANNGRKKIQQKAPKARLIKNAPLGLITFGTSKEARICDITMGVSLLTSIAFAIFRVNSSFLIILSLGVLLLSFNLHCILNGKTYRYIKAFHLAKKNKR